MFLQDLNVFREVETLILLEWQNILEILSSLAKLTDHVTLHVSWLDSLVSFYLARFHSYVS